MKHWNEHGQKCRGMRGRMRTLMLFILFLPVLLAGCAREETDLYAVSEEFIGLLWNVDYREFRADETTEFAKKYYESAYLEDYLQDTEENAGVNAAKSDELISRALWCEDAGTREESIDGQAYTIQQVRARIQIQHFQPEDPSMSFFEEGMETTLLYNVYFMEDEGVLRIAGYDFSPEGEEFLPAGEKEELSQEGWTAISNIARQYLLIRYNIPVDASFVDTQWAFYSQYAAPDFLERDGISRESLETLLEEWQDHGVRVSLEESTIEAGRQKKYVSVGEERGFYYWAELDYTYRIEADEAYFAAMDIGERNTVKEILYFEETESGGYRIVGADYSD